MKKIIIFIQLTVLLATLSLLQGCITSAVTTSVVSSGAQAAYEHRSLQNTLHDQYITVQIDRAIHWKTDQYQTTSRISISTFNGVVLLTGQVSSQKLHDRLIKIVKSVKGVNKVYNLTTVNNPASTLTQLSDCWITTKIKTRIIAANEIDPNQIKVITENGTVILIGTVFPNQASIATDIARQTYGVQDVIRVFSYLHVSKSPLPDQPESLG
jgi:osmotically-inducible protein OsmY